MSPSSPLPNEIVACVLDAWRAGADDEAVTTQLVQLGLQESDAVNALELVRSGIARAAFTSSGLPPNQITSDMDHDPIFRITVEIGQLQSAKMEPECGLDEEKVLTDLQSDDVELRRTAVYQLGKCKQPRAISALLSALGDPDTYVRVYTIQSLAMLGPREAVRPLCALLTANESRIIVTNVIMAVARIRDCEAVPALIAATRHTDAFIRHDAAWALGEFSDERAVPALQVLLDDQTVPVEKDELGLTTQTSIYSVGDQAARSLSRINRR